MTKAPHCERNGCALAERYGVGGMHQCSPECAEIAAMRSDFERQCMTLMQAKRDAGTVMASDNGCEVAPQALFWRKDNGEYGVEMFNAAWRGYQWGFEAGRALTEIAP